MATSLRRRIDAAKTDAASREIRRTVERILDDVGSRGGAAVRKFSQQFDRWSPPSFRLSQADLDTIVAQVPADTLDDIRFAQAQIRNFAEHQRAALHDVPQPS